MTLILTPLALNALLQCNPNPSTLITPFPSPASGTMHHAAVCHGHWSSIACSIISPHPFWITTRKINRAGAPEASQTTC
jgi:hypothetical protein